MVMTLDFAFWPVREATVRDNLRAFTMQTGIPVAPRPVPGAYHSVLTAEFVAGTGPDVFYAQRAEAASWGAAGFVAPLIPAPDIVGRMDARLADGARDATGQLLGLTYYNGGPFTLFLRADVDEAPASWRALLDLMRRCKKDGLSTHPFVPRWHRGQTGLVWSLLCHLATEGVLRLDVAEAEEVLADVLGIWTALLAEGLVPSDSLDDTGDVAALTRWTGGAHIATFTMDYLAADIAEATPPFGVPVARLPGRTGTPLMPGHALLCIRQGLDATRYDAALRLAVFLGGEAVHRRWLRDHLFAVAYPDLTAEPDSRAAMLRHFPAAQGLEAVDRIIAQRHAAVTSPITQRPCALAWSALADRTIRAALRASGAGSVRRAAQQVVAAWRRMDG